MDAHDEACIVLCVLVAWTVEDASDSRELLHNKAYRVVARRSIIRSASESSTCRVAGRCTGYPIWTYCDTCGLYQLSHSKACEHNRVNGLVETKFAPSSIQQVLLSAMMIPKRQERLRNRAAHQSHHSHRAPDRKGLHNQLMRATTQLQTVTRNLASAEHGEPHTATQAVFNEIHGAKSR